MGGKVWSEEEERVFWEVVIPQSPNAADPTARMLSWKECCILMKRSIGKGARREYTGTMLYEHHYQNFKPGPKSPKANKFLVKYIADIERFSAKPSSPKSAVSPPVVLPKAAYSGEKASVSSQPRPLASQLPAQAPRVPVPVTQYRYTNSVHIPKVNAYTVHRGNQPQGASFRPQLPRLVIQNSPAVSYGMERRTRVQTLPTVGPVREPRAVGAPDLIDPTLQSPEAARYQNDADTGEDTPISKSNSDQLGGTSSRSASASGGTPLSSSGSPLSELSELTTPASASPAVEAGGRANVDEPSAATQGTNNGGNTQKRKRFEMEESEENAAKRRETTFQYGHQSLLGAAATRSIRHSNFSEWYYQTNEARDAKYKWPEKPIDSETKKN